MRASRREALLFPCFLLSGFCSLLYQVVWMRLAMASFGVITPVMSVVVSVFMLGLAVGSWGAGRWIVRRAARGGASAIHSYALIELGIGCGALAVPRFFAVGEDLLLAAGQSDSLSYLLFSAAVLALSLLPWCILMGATVPVAMAFVNEDCRHHPESFSWLYSANVIGAAVGVALTGLVLVELLGFWQTLMVGCSTNCLIAATAFLAGFLFRRQPVISGSTKTVPPVHESPQSSVVAPSARRLTPVIVFTTGLCSMGLELVWTRSFQPVLGTLVYSFSLLLFTYLSATWMGSWFYRRDLRRGRAAGAERLLTMLAVAGFIPICLNDPRVSSHAMIALLSIFPLSVLLGYLTPRLIDDYSMGDPAAAGRAYALNTIGCILGPLAASYLLLPTVGARWSMIVLAAPFLAFGLFHVRTPHLPPVWRGATGTLAAALATTAVVINCSYEEYARASGATIRRDHTATVISGGEGMNKTLVVNGVGITRLTPITKIMAHLPLSHCAHKPRSALVICFGMGTTFRSSMSWGIHTTAVELAPSVKEAFGYYFSDAPDLLRDPKARIVIDDGRRFLKRTWECYDVITIDPPPPPAAAGSSLLYSREFYGLAKKRLAEGGVLQQWLPPAEPQTAAAVARSLMESFSYVQILPSFHGWGYHFLASEKPLPALTAEEMIARLPPPARADLMEWSPDETLRGLVGKILERRIEGGWELVRRFPDPRITDDQPFNEYFLLRSLLRRKKEPHFPLGSSPQTGYGGMNGSLFCGPFVCRGEPSEPARIGLGEKIEEVLAVGVVLGPGQPLELLRRDEAFPQGDFFEARDLQPLSLLDRVHEVGGL